MITPKTSTKKTNPKKDPRVFRGVSVRTTDEIELRLDRLAMMLSKPGEGRATRAYAARVALLRGLETLEGGAPDA